MFGRHWKREYQTREYRLFDKETGEFVIMRKMSLSDPILVMMWVGVSIAVVMAMLFYFVELPNSVGVVAISNGVVIGEIATYVMMTEKDGE